MKTHKQFYVAIYVRLSKDDGNSESQSIATQKRIILQYAKERGWNIVDIYADDGFTGTNFNRPDFQRMINDIEKGKINCVITKDLSSLGRNSHKTGYYMEEYFPEHNIRYVAINDNYDSYSGDNMYAPFSNVVNELYPKQTSIKTRQAKKSGASKGRFMGSKAPYGYQKSPADKHLLLIDRNASDVVKRIFALYVAGENSCRIAEILNKEKIPNPTAYDCLKSGKTPPANTLWGSATISAMLKKQVYIGNMEQCKREVVSIQTKKRGVTDSDEHILVENTHEAIIERDLWNQVQELLRQNYRYRSPKKDQPDEYKQLSLFAGFVRCADCGSNMVASKRGRKGNEKMSYRCSKYTVYGKDSCSSHNIREEILEAIILQDIRHYAKLAAEDEQMLIKHLSKQLCTDTKQDKALTRRKLKETEKRLAEVNLAMKKLFEAQISGKMPETVFYGLLSDYEKELTQLNE